MAIIQTHQKTISAWKMMWSVKEAFICLQPLIVFFFVDCFQSVSARNDSWQVNRSLEYRAMCRRNCLNLDKLTFRFTLGYSADYVEVTLGFSLIFVDSLGKHCVCPQK